GERNERDEGVERLGEIGETPAEEERHEDDEILDALVRAQAAGELAHEGGDGRPVGRTSGKPGRGGRICDRAGRTIAFHIEAAAAGNEIEALRKPAGKSL